MAMGQYLQEDTLRNGGYKTSTAGKYSCCSNDSPAGGFDCNICLDNVQEPVVTLCGHLYCWPCIYKWLNFPVDTHLSPEQHQPPPGLCPVCKAEVEMATLVPLYGRENTTREGKPPHLGLIVPRRPSAAYWMDARSRSYTSPFGRRSPFLSPTSLADAMVGVFGEMVYARVFGDAVGDAYSYAGSYAGSPRLRRHVVQADRSLGRICFFLCCCMVLCLIVF